MLPAKWIGMLLSRQSLVAFTALLIAPMMTGCQTLSTSDEAVCTAIGNPISYTSKTKTSDYYAAGKLAPQLAVKNRTGINLDCPAYKR